LDLAFEQAVKSLGEPGAINQEFAKVRRRGHNRAYKEVCLRVCCWGSAATVGVLGGWAIAQTEMSGLAKALRLAATVLAMLYFLKLPFLYPQLSRAGQASRELVRFASILAWPAWVYSVPPEIGPGFHLALLGFGSIIPALVLAFSFGLELERPAPLLLPVILASFDEPAKRSLENARMEAIRFQHDFIGTEHLLLGLLRDEQSLAAKVMSKRGVTARVVATAIEQEVPRGHARAASQNPPRTPRANRALELAANEARAMNRDVIKPEHLFLGLLLEGSGIAARVLTRLGVKAEAVRQEIQGDA
jgi:hypothetical protein